LIFRQTLACLQVKIFVASKFKKKYKQLCHQSTSEIMESLNVRGIIQGFQWYMSGGFYSDFGHEN